jgi:hypothetical protein
LAVITANGSPLTYTLGQDGQIYQLVQSASSSNTSQYTLTSAFAPPNTQVTGMVGIKNQIFALSQQTTNGTAGNYAITPLTLGPHSGLQAGKSALIDAAHLPNGQTPALITAWNDGAYTTIYVVLTSLSTPNSATILAYTVDTKGLNGPASSAISVSEHIISLTATATQLFLLLADGSVWSSAIAADHTVSNVAQVLVNQPIAAPLSTNAQNFTVNTSVPTVTPATQKGTVPLAIQPASNPPALLSAATVTEADGTAQYHLFIGDPVSHRVLDLTPLASVGGPNTTPTNNIPQGLTLTLVQQYVSPGYFNPIKGLATDSNATIYILGQHPSSNEDLVVISIGSQKSCAS